MPYPDLQIIETQQNGQAVWQVWLGKRCWSFTSQYQAREVAAQLHFRLIDHEQSVAPPTSLKHPQ